MTVSDVSPAGGVGAERTTARFLTDAAVASTENARDPRAREVAQALIRHLHAFAEEVHLTEAEWWDGIRFLTRAGQICSDTRQEFILLSDVLGLSMLVDQVNHGGDVPGGTVAPTESTVTGPFYAPHSPERDFAASSAERPSGDPALVHGRVTDTAGLPIAGATLDVWQNGDDMLYAVQDPAAPANNLRGVYHSRQDGAYALLGVRPVPYPIPHDGPVGDLLTALGRHPWRPAHVHFTVSAPGYLPVTTHVFDAESDYLDSDAVFGVKPSLVRAFTRHEPGDADRPAGVGEDQTWYSTEFDIVLRPDPAA